MRSEGAAGLLELTGTLWCERGRRRGVSIRMFGIARRPPQTVRSPVRLAHLRISQLDLNS